VREQTLTVSPVIVLAVAVAGLVHAAAATAATVTFRNRHDVRTVHYVAAPGCTSRSAISMIV
jgi:hypothetical protein